jgi:hypothetical protein
MALEQLITLPLRVGVRAANLTLRVTGEAAGRAFMVAEQVVRVVRPEAEPEPAPMAAPTRAPSARPPAPSARPPAPSARPPAPSARPPALRPNGTIAAATTPTPTPSTEPSARAPLPRLDQEPDHVSEEPVLVEEFADPGAEDGAGAEVTVDEPWAGYRQLTAQELIERLVALSPEELAAVQLYEGTHRRRDTVLTAVEHQLRLAS